LAQAILAQYHFGSTLGGLEVILATPPI